VPYLGPEFSDDEIARYLRWNGYPADHLDDVGRWARGSPSSSADGKVVGLFVGRMEFGPARSAPVDHRRPALTRHAVDHEPEDQVPRVVPAVRPRVLAERASEVFDIDVESPYMMLTAPVSEALRAQNGHRRDDDLRAWVNEVRSELPAITHVDYSARCRPSTASAARASTPS
jgi:carbamoyltransferase